MVTSCSVTVRHPETQELAGEFERSLRPTGRVVRGAKDHPQGANGLGIHGSLTAICECSPYFCKHFCLKSPVFTWLPQQVIDVSKLFNPQSFLTAIKQVCGDAHLWGSFWIICGSEGSNFGHLFHRDGCGNLRQLSLGFSAGQLKPECLVLYEN